MGVWMCFRDILDESETSHIKLTSRRGRQAEETRQWRPSHGGRACLPLLAQSDDRATATAGGTGRVYPGRVHPDWPRLRLDQS